jgi:hypothetical protein
MPVPTIVTVLPDTVQTDWVVEVKVTVSPEEAVAVRPIRLAPKTILLSAPNVIVCGFFTKKLSVTGVATAYCAFPPCVAVIEQAPTATSVTEEPDTVQTPVVVEI